MITKDDVLTFLGSAGGAALVTVVFAGFAGQFISCNIQNRLKDREFNDAWLKARGDQALLARREFLESRRNAFEQLMMVAGTMANTSEELIYVGSPQLSLGQLRGADRRRQRETQAALAYAYRAAEEKWAPARTKFNYQVAYYCDGNRDLVTQWSDAERAVDDLRRCAETVYDKWYLSGRPRQKAQPIPERFVYRAEVCDDKQRDVNVAVRNFGKAVAESSHYAWDGWDSPAKLKRQLDLSSGQREPDVSAPGGTPTRETATVKGAKN